MLLTSAVVVSLLLTADELVARVLSSKSVPEQYKFCFILFATLYFLLYHFYLFIYFILLLLFLFLLLVTSFHHVFPLKKYMFYISQLGEHLAQ